MVIKEGYKQTEIGVIPDDWKIVSIAKVTNEIFLGLTSKVDYVNNGGFPLIRATDISNGKLNFENVKSISTEQHKSLTKYRKAKRGDVLVSKSGSLGVCAKVDVDIEFSIYESIIVLQPKSHLDSEFLLWLLRDEKTQERIIGEKVGSSVAHLNIEMFRRLDVQIPTLLEQTAIATALSDADALITGLEKLITKKRNVKQGAMQQLLQPKEGWEVKKLGEVATIVRGASPRPIEDTKWFDKQSPIGWVRISDVTKSKKVLLETTQKLSDLGVKNSRLVENGNLIMSICATVGRPILTTFDVCIHDGFVVFKNPQVDRQYLYYFLTFIEDNWAKSGQTGSQMNLNTTLINNTEIPFPKSPEEQTRIATILSDMDAELTVLEQKLEKYKKIKLGMMQELLTGRTRLV
jgi:type I restriction enzyme S subunit